MSHPFKSQDWLPLLHYGLDLLLNPAPYKLLQSFEAWEHQNRFRLQLYKLERAKLLERGGSRENTAWSLTARGQLAACGGSNPLQRWRRSWDQKWHMLLFDLPVGQHQQRVKLWRWLREQRFGLLQRSVWVTPDRIDEALLPVARLKLSPGSFTLIEGRPSRPVSDVDLVASAWDFAAINTRYQAVLDLAERGLGLAGRAETKPWEFRQWLALEREAWVTAAREDPFLPEPLLPAGYLGQAAWQRRQAAYAAVAKAGLEAGRD